MNKKLSDGSYTDDNKVAFSQNHGEFLEDVRKRVQDALVGTTIAPEVQAKIDEVFDWAMNDNQGFDRTRDGGTGNYNNTRDGRSGNYNGRRDGNDYPNHQPNQGGIKHRSV